MSALEQALTDYLRLRRSLGHELAEAALAAAAASSPTSMPTGHPR